MFFFAQPCAAAGGQDGRFRLWDTRAHSNPGKVKLHAGPKGTGAVSGIVMGAIRGYLQLVCIAAQVHVLGTTLLHVLQVEQLHHT